MIAVMTVASNRAGGVVRVTTTYATQMVRSTSLDDAHARTKSEEHMMSDWLIDLFNRFHYWHCDRCGVRVLHWKREFPDEVPLCQVCSCHLTMTEDILEELHNHCDHAGAANTSCVFCAAAERIVELHTVANLLAGATNSPINAYMRWHNDGDSVNADILDNYQSSKNTALKEWERVRYGKPSKAKRNVV